MSDDYERTTKLDNVGGFVRLRVKLKRGDSPRDEDSVTGELLAGSLDELEAQLAQFDAILYDAADKARAYQPEDDNE